jgi:prepilin-type N-terminal cleavage/methylation domain-containing protein
MTLRHRTRTAFTLMEMLVVIGVILVIATIGLYLVPKLDRHKGVPNAVAQLHGWINLSKQHALRDQAPRGLRLIHDGDGRVTSAVYIEQPDPVAPQGPGVTVDVRVMPVMDPVLFPTMPGNVGLTTVVTLFRNGPPPPPPNPLYVPPGQFPANQNQWMDWEGVQPGDYFELTENPRTVATIRRFTYPYPPDVPPGPQPPANPVGPAKFAQLVLDRIIEGTESGAGFHRTTGFRVIRSPRPLIGEPMLQMHKDVFVDLTACYPCPLNLDAPAGPANNLFYQFPVYNGSAPQGPGWMSWSPLPIPFAQRRPQPVPVDVNHIDILFNKSGFVANAPTGQYIIAVRHKERPEDMLFITIYTRTGKITQNIWNAVGPDPYLFTRDGSTPGL